MNVSESIEDRVGRLEQRVRSLVTINTTLLRLLAESNLLAELRCWAAEMSEPVDNSPRVPRWVFGEGDDFDDIFDDDDGPWSPIVGVGDPAACTAGTDENFGS